MRALESSLEDDNLSEVGENKKIKKKLKNDEKNKKAKLCEL